MTSEKLPHGGAAMDRASVPEQDNRPAQMAKEKPQEIGDLEMGDVVEMEVAVQPEALTMGADGHGGDRRDSLVVVAMNQQRGLRPVEPRCGARWESAESRSRPGMPGAPSGATLFFNLDPAMTLPALDGRLVSLQRSSLGLLIAPAEIGQDAGHVRRMIVDPELPSDDGGDPPRCPPVVRIAVSQGTPRQNLRQSRRCRSVSFLGRPGAGFAARPASPLRRQVLRHDQTALIAAPTILATAVSELPASNSRTARRRRRSNSAGLPCGRIPARYHGEEWISITYATLNNLNVTKKRD